MSVSGQEIIDGHMSDFAGVIAGKGITPEFLACQLKRELHAKETKLVKIRSFPPKQLQEQDANVVAINGPAVKRGRGKAAAYRTVYEGGIAEDTVIAVDMVNWGVRQAARIDAQKLLGAYPAAKVAVGGDPDNPIRITGLTDAELLDIARGSGGGAATP